MIAVAPKVQTVAGIEPRTPPLRASDMDLLLSCPFAYFLRVRLGLRKITSISKALTRGSWFHKKLELLGMEPLEADAHFDQALGIRLRELNEALDRIGHPPDWKANRLEDERQHAQTAKAIFDAAAQIPINEQYGTFPQFLDRMNLLGCELLAVSQRQYMPNSLAAVSACRYDRLYYDPNGNALWILDAKTTDARCIDRLQICPVEFATRHYIHILRDLLEGGYLHQHFKLPEDVKLGGMIHLAIQKPGIEMCGEDRDFQFIQHTLKSGPRKGQVEMRKEYLSTEPRFENYVARCVRWMRGEGEYLDKRAEREAHPCVNLSFTPASLVLDKEATATYYAMLDYLHDHATMTPSPSNFFMNGSALLEYGKLSDLAPFYLTSPAMWPEVMAREGFVVDHRDPEITPSTEPGIY